ncbi:unnamed protein product [Rhizophagus irregularis]|nr:unnamed protein product [Rhizophagus irregularis]
MDSSWTNECGFERLDDSQNISSSYINQIKTFHKCLQSVSLAGTFGITKDPTSNYMIVIKYYENGNLYQYLDHCNGILSWRDMIDMLWGIAGGLERIHSEGKIHGNLHGGNLLIEDEKVSTDARISDVGLHGPCDNDLNNELMQQCWDNDPKNRPTASYLNEKLGEWIILICDDPNPSEISDENSVAEEKRWKMVSQFPQKNSHPKTHPEAYYTSILYITK